MKTKPMRLWAVVIGRKGLKRQIVYSFHIHALAVFKSRKEARREKEILQGFEGHEDNHVIPFESK